MQSNMNIDQSGANNSFSQWGMQAVTNAYQKTSNAISKAIKKNKVKLKYGTFVYLVNGKEKKEIDTARQRNCRERWLIEYKHQKIN